VDDKDVTAAELTADAQRDAPIFAQSYSTTCSGLTQAYSRQAAQSPAQGPGSYLSTPPTALLSAQPAAAGTGAVLAASGGQRRGVEVRCEESSGISRQLTNLRAAATGAFASVIPKGGSRAPVDKFGEI
jgi:hypothetical protein